MNYLKIYNQIIERAKGRELKGYFEKHHIIPKCVGGKDNECNLVKLTAREHFICHMLLVEIYPDDKLKIALYLMAMGRIKNNYKPSNRTYERLRKEHSKRMKGVKQSTQTLEKRKQSLIGKDLSKNYTSEVRLKMSKKMKGRKVTWGDKISESKKGISREITWGDKISESKKGKKKKTKIVLQIDPQTNQIIKEYSSTKEAIYQTHNKGIPNALSGISKTSGGFIWKYKN